MYVRSQTIKENRAMLQSPLERAVRHELTLRPTLFIYSITTYGGLRIASPVWSWQVWVGIAGEAARQGE